MREPSEIERAVLARLLSADFEGVEQLRDQAQVIQGVEPNCTCGCPSVTLDIDRTAAPPTIAPSMLPVELFEWHRADGLQRTVLCFLDDGYLANLECVYYDDKAQPLWPDPSRCGVIVDGTDRGIRAVVLPRGAVVRPQNPDDRWLKIATQVSDGLRATTFTGYQECFAADGSLLTRELVTMPVPPAS